MQRWEYSSVVVFDGVQVHRMTPESTEFTRVGREKSKGDKGFTDAAYRIIAQLGLDGWEMVSTNPPTHRPKGVVYWFKRLLPEGKVTDE